MEGVVGGEREKGRRTHDAAEETGCAGVGHAGVHCVGEEGEDAAEGFAAFGKRGC